MAIDPWPAVLPQSPLVEGTEELLVDTRVAFQPDAGPSTVMSQFTRSIKVVTYQIAPLRDFQKDTLDYFIEYTLAGGVEPFSWASPAWNSYAFIFKFLSLPSYTLKRQRSLIAEAAASEGPVGPGYPTYTNQIQRVWFAGIQLVRHPWYPFS